MRRVVSSVPEENPVPYETPLVDGVTVGNTTTFIIKHGLNTERPKRLITKMTGDKQEQNPIIKIISEDEVEVMFSPKIKDNECYAMFWK